MLVDPARPEPVTEQQTDAVVSDAGSGDQAGSETRVNGSAPLPPRWQAWPNGHDIDAAIKYRTMEIFINDEAKKLLAIRRTAEAAAAAPPPPLVCLDNMLSTPDDALGYRVAGLLTEGGRVLFAAQFKSGKTTAVHNLIRSLADGDKFLGHFPVKVPLGRIVLVDNEMDERFTRQWLREQGIWHPQKIYVVSLRGQAARFNIMDPMTRSEWAARLRAINAKFLILDCLRPMLDALDLSEDKDGGKFTTALNALLFEANIPECVLVTHMGHQGQRARGDSSLLGWSDTNWRLTRPAVDGDDDDPAAPRYFSAFGRGVDVPEGLITRDGQVLSYGAGVTRRTAASVAALPAVLELLAAAADAISGNGIETALRDSGHTQKAVREAVKAGIAAKKIFTEDGPRNATLHFLNPAARVSSSDLVASSSTRSE